MHVRMSLSFLCSVYLISSFILNMGYQYVPLWGLYITNIELQEAVIMKVTYILSLYVKILSGCHIAPLIDIPFCIRDLSVN